MDNTIYCSNCDDTEGDCKCETKEFLFVAETIIEAKSEDIATDIFCDNSFDFAEKADCYEVCDKCCRHVKIQTCSCEDETAKKDLRFTDPNTINGRNLYLLVEDDAHDMLSQITEAKRDTLTDDELARVKKGLSWGLGECWSDIMQAAVEDAIKE